MLTVEIDVIVESKRTNERGSFMVGSLCLSSCTRDFYSALAALVGPLQNIFFLTRELNKNTLKSCQFMNIEF